MTGGWKTKSGGVTGDAPLDVFLEQRSEGIGMSCMVPSWGNWKLIEKVERAFFDKVAELLYGLPIPEKLK